MITTEMLGKIRRMHLRDKLSLHGIATRTGLSRNTLCRWLRVPQEVQVPLKSFVNTLRRDYLSRMDLSDALTVMRQLPAAFEHFNEMHHHSSLKMKSLRQFTQ